MDLDRLETVTYADGTYETFAYDRNGNVRYHTDRNGTLIENTYTKLNQLSRSETLSKPEGIEAVTQWFWYDGAGRLLKSRDRNEETGRVVERELSYDSLGNAIREIQAIDGVTAEIQRAFDHTGRRVSLTYDNGRELTYQYQDDALDRLRTLVEDGSPRAAWDYLGGLIQERSLFTAQGAEVTSPRTFDGLKRVTSLRHVREGDPATLLLGFDYGYDRMDNVLYEDRLHRDPLEPAGVTTGDAYFYDTLYRVKEARYGCTDVSAELSHPEQPQGAQSRLRYGLDEAGNWATLTDLSGILKTNVLDAAPPESLNQYVQFWDMKDLQAVYDLHDANGQRTETRKEGAYKYGLAYDARDRLVEVTDQNTGGALIARYAYYASGLRAAKILPERTIYYFYDGPECIEEREVAGQETHVHQYVYGPGLDRLVELRRNVGEASEAVRYPLADRMGTVRALLDEDGTLVERYKTDLYGANLQVEHRGPDGVFDEDPSQNVSAEYSLEGNAFYFQGRRLDEETGFYYFRARYYDPKEGRFLSMDPLGVWGDGVNRGNGYAFGGGNPLRFRDPFGRDAAPPLAYDVPGPAGPKAGMGFAQMGTGGGITTASFDSKRYAPVHSDLPAGPVFLEEGMYLSPDDNNGLENYLNCGKQSPRHKKKNVDGMIYFILWYSGLTDEERDEYLKDLGITRDQMQEILELMLKAIKNGDSFEDIANSDYESVEEMPWDVFWKAFGTFLTDFGKGIGAAGTVMSGIGWTVLGGSLIFGGGVAVAMGFSCMAISKIIGDKGLPMDPGSIHTQEIEREYMKKGLIPPVGGYVIADYCIKI